MKRIVSVYEAKAHLSKIIAAVERTHQAVTISRHGKPTVDIVAHIPEVRDPLMPNPALQGAAFHGDPCAPVDDADWPQESR